MYNVSVEYSWTFVNIIYLDKNDCGAYVQDSV